MWKIAQQKIHQEHVISLKENIQNVWNDHGFIKHANVNDKCHPGVKFKIDFHNYRNLSEPSQLNAVNSFCTAFLTNERMNELTNLLLEKWLKA